MYVRIQTKITNQTLKITNQTTDEIFESKHAELARGDLWRWQGVLMCMTYMPRYHGTQGCDPRFWTIQGAPFSALFLHHHLGLNFSKAKMCHRGVSPSNKTLWHAAYPKSRPITSPSIFETLHLPLRVPWLTDMQSKGLILLAFAAPISDDDATFANQSRQPYARPYWLHVSHAPDHATSQNRRRGEL